MNISSYRRPAIIFFYILLLVNVIFIFANSLPDKEQSADTSTEVTEIVKPILEPVVGKGKVTDHLVRKLAHFVEFGSLGVISAILMLLERKTGVQHTANRLFFGLATALSDETVQIFSDRGSQVQDVWLDFSGFVTGIAAVLIIHAVIKAFGRNGAKKCTK